MYEDLKQTIVEIARTMDQKNLVNTYEGNLSIKKDDKILITPSGRSKASLTTEMIAVIDETGKQYRGNSPLFVGISPACRGLSTTQGY